MTVIINSNRPQYLNSNHVTYYVITCKSAFDWVYAEQWYVIITSDVTTVSEWQIKFPELESKLVVHSSIRKQYSRLNSRKYFFSHWSLKGGRPVKQATNATVCAETISSVQKPCRPNVLPRFSKGQGAIWKGHFSAVNGPSKGHFSAVNGLSKGHFSAVNWRKRA